ncbi:hypothetical protein AJ79_08560 [Helicocarpus griseus UAMH5409]|uniref:Uncharacterized protein n=1 Tax=Helicocarpus griseus UAMH5409 TaxID=1447875 RepID=A0A2B7WS03_9EURO|nr:hypothetical protein AJ79_08560 [Helicocarpus griseus UAMH5409]
MYQIEANFYPEETHRFDSATGNVACWPSTGGIWVSSLHPVEVQYLSIDRFSVVERSSEQEEEDRFCQMLRIFGASWWDLSPDRITYDFPTALPRPIKPLIEIKRKTCVKEDGYLILDTFDRAVPLPDRLMGELRLTLNMKERCDVLNKWGAVFCEDTGCASFKNQPEEIHKPGWKPDMSLWSLVMSYYNALAVYAN